MPSEVTLQINLSGGDIAYAETTVPALVAAHRESVREVLGVVDCCRPQRTQMIDPEEKFPLKVFDDRVERIRDIAERFRRGGVLDRLIFVEKRDERIARLLKRYVGRLITETHDCYGCGLVSYLYGFVETKTRFMLHYDADMLLHQADGYDWTIEALECLAKEPNAIAATPRVSPPFAAELQRPDAPSLHESDVFLQPRDGYWRLGWFSARCFLIDLQRLQGWLPLLDLRDPRYFCEVLARKFLARGYPPATEVLIHCRARQRGAYRLDLMTQKAFILHPNDKGERFLRLLPRILESIRFGRVPREQLGWENVIVDAWEKHFAATHS